MTDHKLSIAWGSYQNNICYGLSLLQQKGEFVDMTLAADGHHVKVHQMVMSLVSPFIKDLITSAQCPHPVIFLNKVSYDTLQLILEYVYTGEVLVARDNLYQFLEACKELHIKGLEGNIIQTKGDGDLLHLIGARAGDDPETKTPDVEKPLQIGAKRRRTEMSKDVEYKTTLDHDCIQNDNFLMDEHALDDVDEASEVKIVAAQETNESPNDQPTNPKPGPGATVQYSLSCQGNIQLILNRYIYCMRHTRKNNERMWRCVNYTPTGCNATTVTKDDMVIFRGRAHNHPFHDKQILKRVHNNNIYTAFRAIEQLSSLNKKLTPILKRNQVDEEITMVSTD